MDTFEALHTRRSIRKYSSGPVDAGDIRKILAAAMMAPSAGNGQPWQFILIDDRAILSALSQAIPHAEMVADCRTAILLCGDLSREKYAGFWVQDCSACGENLLLATHALGLGAVWIGVYPLAERTNALRKMFSLPEHVIAFALFPVGHPAETVEHENRFDPDRIHRNQW